MNAYEVLKEHHVVLKGLGRKVSEAPLNSQERHELFDEMLLELDIHFRIEDDLYYPALAAASELIAIAHAEHRQVVDQLGVLLRTRRARRLTSRSGTPSKPCSRRTPTRKNAT